MIRCVILRCNITTRDHATYPLTFYVYFHTKLLLYLICTESETFFNFGRKQDSSNIKEATFRSWQITKLFTFESLGMERYFSSVFEMPSPKRHISGFSVLLYNRNLFCVEKHICLLDHLLHCYTISQQQIERSVLSSNSKQAAEMVKTRP